MPVRSDERLLHGPDVDNALANGAFARPRRRATTNRQSRAFCALRGVWGTGWNHELLSAALFPMASNAPLFCIDDIRCHRRAFTAILYPKLRSQRLDG